MCLSPWIVHLLNCEINNNNGTCPPPCFLYSQCWRDALVLSSCALPLPDKSKQFGRPLHYTTTKSGFWIFQREARAEEGQQDRQQVSAEIPVVMAYLYLLVTALLKTTNGCRCFFVSGWRSSTRPRWRASSDSATSSSRPDPSSPWKTSLKRSVVAQCPDTTRVLLLLHHLLLLYHCSTQDTNDEVRDCNVQRRCGLQQLMQLSHVCALSCTHTHAHAHARVCVDPWSRNAQGKTCPSGKLSCLWSIERDTMCTPKVGYDRPFRSNRTSHLFLWKHQIHPANSHISYRVAETK